jgi:hypothetical protein
MKIKEMRKNNRLELAAIHARKLSSSLNERFSASTSSKQLWSKLRKNFKKSSSLEAFIDDNNDIVRDNDDMLEIAASYYENLFSESSI